MKATQLSTEENIMNSNVRRTPFITAWMAAGLASIITTMSALGQFSITQPAGITINDFSTATPYPSTITVSNVLGTIEKVTVTLTKVTHGYPDDIDVLLVGPGGQTNVVLMSDAGGAPNLDQVTLTFDDGAATSLPDSSQIIAGSYKPTNFEVSDTEFSPAVDGPYGAVLSVFSGAVPNGTWSLYVRDDQQVDSGSIASWTLTLWTTPTLSLATNLVTIAEDTTATVNVTVKDTDTPPDQLKLTGVARPQDQNIVTNTAIVASTTGEARTLTITPKPNAFGTNVITVSVSDSFATNNTTFNLIVTNVNHAPTITLNPNAVSTKAGLLTGNLNATRDDVDNVQADLVLISSASNPSVVGNANVFFGPGTNASTRSFAIAPTGAATGTATVTIY